MNEINMIEDISTLTRIPEYMINHIFTILEKNIQTIIYEQVVLSKKETVNVDIGIGELNINVDNDKGFLTYDFIPSKSLERGIVKVITDKENPIMESVERNLSNKIIALYKELI